MRSSCGCLIEDSMVLHGFDGPCLLTESGPTEEDYCAGGGHGYYGDEVDPDTVPPEHHDEVGRCYCGKVRYPAGGPRDSGSPERPTDSGVSGSTGDQA